MLSCTGFSDLRHELFEVAGRLVERVLAFELGPQCDLEEFYDLARDPEETNNLIDHPEYKSRVDAARKEFAAWREKNPSTYSFDVYGRRAQALALEIDWDAFKKVRPKEYAKIAAQIARLGVSWEQAMNDWEIRYEICSRAGYWY